jgi:signal transduction histidine kinase
MPLEHALVSMDDLVTTVLGSQLPLAAEKGIRLESHLPATLPLAWADRSMIERVLQNLVGNAIKFTPSNGVVSVASWLAEDIADRPRLLVQVRDTGTGIPPSIQDRLFQKFITGEQQGRGSGLGLAFCKMVIEAHGERLWVEQTSNQGTTFAFPLPPPAAMES